AAHRKLRTGRLIPGGSAEEKGVQQNAIQRIQRQIAKFLGRLHVRNRGRVGFDHRRAGRNGDLRAGRADFNDRSTRSRCSNLRKPAASAVTAYVPGFRCVTSYWPRTSVATVRARPVSCFRTVTLAFGTAALLGSITVPVIVPKVACA